jgi:hypothetical protein
MFGTFKAKMGGLRHLYVHYLRTEPLPGDTPLHEPYNNRECLHCHLGARSFEQGAVHNADPDTLPAVKANKLSCISQRMPRRGAQCSAAGQSEILERGKLNEYAKRNPAPASDLRSNRDSRVARGGYLSAVVASAGLRCVGGIRRRTHRSGRSVFSLLAVSG